jgi:trk system potassium uptake protein TrkH
MNYRLISKVLGSLLLLLAGSMSVCLVYAMLDRERQPGLDAVESFWISIGATVLAGAGLVRAGWRSGREILRKEAIAVVGIGWVVCALFGALPFVFCEPGLRPFEAFFESMSGFTTTGATVIADLDRFPKSVLLWRALTQWLGGLGILVLFVALLSYLGVGSKALFRHESSAKTGGGIQARIHDVAMRLWQIYVVLSVVCCLGLWALGMNFYDALTHTFTAISTGGFSPRNESIAAYDSLAIELWLVLFMIAGGMSFMLYAWLLRGGWNRWRKDEESRAYLLLLALATGIIGVDLLLLGAYSGIGESFRVSLFQVVSIMTTTGYATEDFNQWPPFSRVCLLLLMFVGGCAGSTAGSIKVSRWLMFFKTVRVEVLNAFRPNQVVALRLNGNPVDDDLKSQTVFFIALVGLTVGVGTAVVSLLEPQLDMVSSFAAVAATLFNIGPGLNEVGPTRNFAHLGGNTLTFLSLLMVLGRLEFFTILVLFAPSLWRRY